MIRSEWDEVRQTHLTLEQRSLPLSLAPMAKFMMQVTTLKSSVVPRISHSQKRRVIRGQDASGISSVIEW